MNYLYLDFEFSHSNKRYVNLICATDSNGESWKFRGAETFSEIPRIKEYLSRYKGEDLCLVAYGLDAELRSLFSLLKVNTLKELPFTHYLCLHTEHKYFANKSKKYLYGEVVHDGKLKERKYLGHHRMRAEIAEDRKYINLLNALWKFCHIFEEEHVLHKAVYRDICIKGDELEIIQNIDYITEYCAMDTRHLPTLHAEMMKAGIEAVGGEDQEYLKQSLARGTYTAICAEKSQRGYKINATAYYNIKASFPKIVNKICEHILKTFPKYETFRYDMATGRYVFQKSAVIEFLKTQPPSIVAEFPCTKKKQEISITLETLGRFYSGNKHSLNPKDYLQQIYRYLLTVSSLRGIVTEKTNLKSAKPFAAYYDASEQMAHPYLNPFGSLTGRSQPAANGFLLAKPAWMRLLIEPPDDHVMIVADFSKQEPLYLACVSQDQNLLSDYQNPMGLYEAFGLRSGYVSEGMQGSPEWDVLVHALKTAFLASLYGIGHFSLSSMLTAVFKKPISPATAARYITAVDRAYPVSRQWKERQLRKYLTEKKYILRDGWTMWECNGKPLSIKNFPIQGGCGTIMRYADWLAYSKGLHIPMTLHDALYCYCPADKNTVLVQIAALLSSMYDAFQWGVGDANGHQALKIKCEVIAKKHFTAEDSLDIYIKHDKNFTEYTVPIRSQYRDPRAIHDLQMFEPYMFPKIKSTFTLPEVHYFNG